MSSGSSASFFLIVCFLVGSSEALENITVEHGEDVTLRCKADNKNNITVVEWSRPDLDPVFVLLYRDGHFDSYIQHPSYKNRVNLKDREMKDGDVSMILKNVTMNDTGTYKCWVIQEETNHRNRFFAPGHLINIINLEVLPPGDKDGGAKYGGDKVGGDKDGIIVGTGLGSIILAAVACFLIYNRRNMKQNPNLPVPPDESEAEKTVDINYK